MTERGFYRVPGGEGRGGTFPINSELVEREQPQSIKYTEGTIVCTYKQTKKGGQLDKKSVKSFGSVPRLPFERETRV